MTTKPLRIQRKRTKGFRLPPNTISVTRPGKFGNPFETAKEFRDILSQILKAHAAADGLRQQLWRTILTQCNIVDFGHMMVVSQSLDELRGKNLACWCPVDGKRECHADVLIELANK